MALVFLQGNYRFSIPQVPFPAFNTNDTYVMCDADRGYSTTETMTQLLDKLRKDFTVNVLMHERSANNYYVHIGDWCEEAVESGKALCLRTIIFELSAREALANSDVAKQSEVKVDTPQVQPVPEVQG